MDKEDKQIIDRATKEEWRIGDRTRLKRLLEKNLKLYRENVEFEHEVEQLREYNSYMFDTIALKSQQIEKLEKENAELKDDNKVMADNYSKMEQKFYNNLTKAKELLELFVQWNYGCCKEPDYKDLVKQAEQFLKE